MNSSESTAVNGQRHLLTPKEAAAVLAISERKLRYLAKSGAFPAISMGRVVRYHLPTSSTGSSSKSSEPRRH